MRERLQRKIVEATEISNGNLALDIKKEGSADTLGFAVEKTAAASEELLGQSNDVKAMIEQFKTK